jgi:histidinol-phosphate aminotransferase
MRPLSQGIHSLKVWPVLTEDEILRKYGLPRLIKMASNENCYGPSPTVQDALRNLQTNRYPDLHGTGLRDAIAQKFDVSRAQVLVGNGSSEIIQMIAMTYLAPGQECLTALETFPMYSRTAAAVDARCICVPLKSDAYDLQSMLERIHSGTSVIFIANPNNPTGTCVDKAELKKFISAVPANVLVVLDEAYRDYQDGPPDSLTWLADHENLLLLRTFSKVYGLAGLRVGYGIGSEEIIQNLHRVRLPYTVSVPAMVAGIAALHDDQHVANCVQWNREQREMLQQEFAKRGYDFVPSQGNFVLLKKDVAEQLLKKGILVAPLAMFQMPNAVRITLGTPDENQQLLQLLNAL